MTAEKVFNKYIEAIGGKDAVEKVESVVLIAQGNVQGMNMDLESKTTKKGMSSNIVSVNGNVMQKQVFNGTEGYAMAQGQKIPFNEKQIAAAKVESTPFPELITKMPL